MQLSTKNLDEQFNLLLLAFYYGAYFLLSTILFYLPGGVTEHDEFSIFVQGWITVSLLSLITLIGVYKIKHALFQDVNGFFPILLRSNLIFGILAASSLTLASQSGNFLIPLTTVIVILFPLAQIIVIWALHKFPRKFFFLNSIVFAQGVYWLSPISIGVILLLFSGIFMTDKNYVLPIWQLLLAIPFGFLAYFHRYLSSTPRRKIAFIIDILVVIFILEACFDPYFSIVPDHQNFYLGPVNALLHGKTMLVDVYSQYGVFVHEFLAAFFALKILPLNYQGLSFLVGIFCMIQYAGIYYLLKMLLKSPLFSSVALFIIMLMSFFATVATYFPAYPSIGPLRFGLCYVFIVFATLRYKYPARAQIFLLLEYATLGIASIWSFETFIYVAVLCLGLHGYQAITQATSITSGVKRIALEIFNFTLSIVLVNSLQALAIFLRSGVWTNWEYYFEFIYIYSLAGFGGLSVDPWSPWFIIVMIYLIGLIAPFIKWAIDRKPDMSLETQTILSLAFFGIAQFTYYVGRSHPENLLHICGPAIMIASYGIHQLAQLPNNEHPGAKNSSMFVSYIAIALLMIAFIPHLIQKIPNTGFGYIYMAMEDRLAQKNSLKRVLFEPYQRLWNPKPESAEVADAVYLINKYTSPQSRVLVFLPNHNTTEALFLSNRANILPITEPIQDVLSPQISKFIANFKPDFHSGDIVFLPSDPMNLRIFKKVNDMPTFDYQTKVILELCKKFNFTEIEKSGSGISAFRLDASKSGMSDYCTKTKTSSN